MSVGARRVAAGLAALAVAMVGCGGGGEQRPDSRLLSEFSADMDRLPGAASGPPPGFVTRPTRQRYLVFLADSAVMEGKAAVDAMWAAVHGKSPRTAPIRGRVPWVPEGYRVTVDLQFMPLPSPWMTPERFSRLTRGLPAPLVAAAREARSALFIEGDADALPDGGQVRLIGAAALFAAERGVGAVIDLETERGFTADAWHAEIAAPRLSSRQVRLGAGPDPDAPARRWFFSRGNAKFGQPELVMRGVDATHIELARAAFATAEESLLAAPAKVDRALPPLPEATGAKPLPVTPCRAPAGHFADLDCRTVSAPGR